MAYLVSGVVIVESVFAFPGIAKLMVDAFGVPEAVLPELGREGPPSS